MAKDTHSRTDRESNADASAKPGSDPEAARAVGGKGDFGVRADDVINREYASRNTRASDRAAQPRSGEDADGARGSAARGPTTRAPGRAAAATSIPTLSAWAPAVAAWPRTFPSTTSPAPTTATAPRPSSPVARRPRGGIRPASTRSAATILSATAPPWPWTTAKALARPHREPTRRPTPPAATTTPSPERSAAARRPGTITRHHRRTSTAIHKMRRGGSPGREITAKRSCASAVIPLPLEPEAPPRSENRIQLIRL